MKSTSRIRGLLLWCTIAGLGLACGDEDKPLATWGDNELSAAEYDAELSFFLNEGESLADYNLDGLAFLERVVKYRILYDAASRTIPVLSPTDEGRLQLYRDALVREELMEEAFGEPAPIAEEDIRARWEREKVEERHLLHFQAPSLDVVQAFRAAIVGGEPFEPTVTRFSEENPGVRGGELGYMRPNSLPPQFEEEAWRLSPGEISEPFSTGTGYHVLRCTDVRFSPYEELREYFRQEIERESNERRARDLDTYLLQLGQVVIDSVSVARVAERVRAYRDSVPETGGAFPELDVAARERALFTLSGQPFTVRQMTAEMGRFNPRDWPAGGEFEQVAGIARRRALSQIINNIALQQGHYEDPKVLGLVERKRKELIVNTLLRDIWRGLEATDEEVHKILAEGGRDVPGPSAMIELKRELTRKRQAEALDTYMAELLRNLDVTYHADRIPAGLPVDL